MTNDTVFSNFLSFLLALLFAFTLLSGRTFAAMEFLFAFLIMVFVDLIFENDWTW